MVKYTYRTNTGFAVLGGELISLRRAQEIKNATRGWSHLGYGWEDPKIHPRNALYFDYADRKYKQCQATHDLLAFGDIELVKTTRNWGSTPVTPQKFSR